MPMDEESSLAFAADVLIEIAGYDEAFRYPMSSSFTIEGNLMGAMPGEIMLGDETKDGEDNEYGADKKLMFKTSNGKIFFVFVRGQEVWLDVSRLERGDQGSAMYHALATYAHNGRKVFIGDPAGLSPDAIVRRTTAMLSFALRTGVTTHFKPAVGQLLGIPALGIVPLKWGFDDYENLKSLINTFIGNVNAEHPEILASSRFDFRRNRFVVDDVQSCAVDAGQDSDTDQGEARSPQRTGESSARRGVLIKSLMESKGSERPELLEIFFRGTVQLVKTSEFKAIF